jgi:hydroxypyruvate isomerase
MPKFAANLSMLFGELDFLDRFAAAAAAGFRGVEYLFPYDYPKQAILEPLARHDLQQVLFNLPAGNWAAGERGTACHPDRRDEFQIGIERAVEYATALGCRQVNCLAGIAPRAVEPGRLRDTLVANLRLAAERFMDAGIRLLIEPINARHDIPGFYLSGTDQALEVIAEVGSDNLFLQYDVYHMQIMEGDVARRIEQHLPSIAHVQIADNPGRHEPGTGELNFDFLLAHLDRIGYAGWIGCEYRPLRATLAGLDWMSRFRAAALA